MRLENLEDRTVPATIVWGAATSGDFNDGTKWIGGVAPGSGDDAQINLASAVVTVGTNTTVNSLATVGDLSVTAGTFMVNNGGSFSNDITLASGATFDLAGGSLAWTAGTIKSPGTFEVSLGATLALSSGSVKLLSASTLNNLGTINFDGLGTFQLATEAHLNNVGSFHFLSDADLQQVAGIVPTFTNTGLVTKNGGAGLESDIIGFFFNNEGVPSRSITANSASTPARAREEPTTLPQARFST